MAQSAPATVDFLRTMFTTRDDAMITQAYYNVLPQLTALPDSTRRWLDKVPESGSRALKRTCMYMGFFVALVYCPDFSCYCSLNAPRTIEIFKPRLEAEMRKYLLIGHHSQASLEALVVRWIHLYLSHWDQYGQVAAMDATATKTQ